MLLYFIGGSMDLTKQRVADAPPRRQITFARRECFELSDLSNEGPVTQAPDTEVYHYCGSVVGMRETYVYSHVATINHLKG